MSLHFQWIFIFVVGFVSGQDVKRAVGDNVTFRPDSIPSPTTSILWKHKDNAGYVVKAIEWDTVDGVDVPNPKFKNIATLDYKTGEITLTGLKLEHSGVYSIEINSEEQEKKFTLTVMERVPKPEIRTETSNNRDVKYFNCEGDATIIWKNSAGETLSGEPISGPPKELSIAVNNTQNRDNYYTCTLQNDVSEKTSYRVYEKDLFPGEDVKRAVGDNVKFHPDNIPSPTTSILWKHTANDGTVVKAIEWDNVDGVDVSNPKFKNIATLNDKTGEITLTGLKLHHSGVYSIEINSKEQQNKFRLTVMERVPKPEIRI